MPLLNCRDVDETCDWFWRDPDPGVVLVAAVAHTEEAHHEYMERMMSKETISGMLEERVRNMRKD